MSEPLDLDAKKCPTCSGPFDESPVFVGGVAFCDHKCAHSRKGGPLDRSLDLDAIEARWRASSPNDQDIPSLVARVRELEDTYEESVKDRDRLKPRVQSLEEERDDADCERLAITSEIHRAQHEAKVRELEATATRLAEIALARSLTHGDPPHLYRSDCDACAVVEKVIGHWSSGAAIKAIEKAREALGRERGDQ